MMKATTIIAILVIAGVSAGDVWITKDWKVSQNDLDRFKSSLNKVSTLSGWVTWTGYGNGIRWNQKGSIDQSEVDFYNNLPVDSKNVAGGGIQFSRQPNEFREDGPFPVNFVFPPTTLQFNFKYLSILGRKNVSIPEKVALGRIVPFVDCYSLYRCVTHSAQVTTKVFASINDATNPTNQVQPDWPKSEWNGQGLWTSLWDVVNTATKSGLPNFYKDTANWLNSFYSLFYYMDTIALSRAIIVNPSDPWAQFEPQHFEAFRKTRDLVITQLLSKKVFGVAVDGKFGAKGMNKDQWVNHQINQVIPFLYSNIAGTPENPVAEYRIEEVRAGGSDPNQTFLVVPQELNAMKNNMYLETFSYPAPNNQNYVYYYYPDSSHWSRIANKLPPALVQQLKAVSPQQLKKDDKLRQSLNRQIISALMVELFSRYYGKEISQFGVQFSIDFVSIHPFGDYNGRTTRFYQHLAYYETASQGHTITIPHEYISDFDTVTPLASYSEFIHNGAIYIEALMTDLFKELVKSLVMQRTPSYYQLPAWKELPKSLSVFGLKGGVKEWTSEQLNLIEKRRFTHLLNNLIGNDWGKNLHN